MDSTHTIFTLQREALFRARRVIFSSLSALGGIPTLSEEESQDLEDARATRSMVSALRNVLDATCAQDALFPAFPKEQRDYWQARAPSVLCFGARTHAELTRLAPYTIEDARPSHAAAFFQLAASLLDWIGDEDGASADIFTWLPAIHFRPLITQPSFRRELFAGVRREARPPTIAFATLLGATIDLVSSLPQDTARFSEFLSLAYEAELASFGTIASVEERQSIARRKSMSPTIVVGELARLTANEDESGVVWKAMTTIAPVFGVLDDIADLSEDLKKQHVNTLCAAPVALDDGEIAHTLRSLLATDLIEESAAGVVRNVRELDELLEEAHVAPRQRCAALGWLRTMMWRWLY